MLHRDETCAEEARKAREALTEANTGPDRAQILEGLARCHRGTTFDCSSAIETMQEITTDPLIEEPYPTRALKQIADYYQEMGQWGRAAKLYDDLLQDEEKRKRIRRKEVRFTRVLCLLNAGDEDRAVSELKDMIPSASSPTSLYCLATIYYKRGQFKEAAEYFETSLEAPGNRKRCFNTELWLAACYEELGRGRRPSSTTARSCSSILMLGLWQGGLR